VQKIRRTIALAAAVTVGLLVLRFEGDVTLVLLAGGLFAIGLRGVALPASKRSGLPYPVCVGVAVSVLVGLSATGVYFLGATLASQARGLFAELPGMVRDAVQAVERDTLVCSLLGPTLDRRLAQGPGAVAAGAGMVLAESGRLVATTVVVFFVGVYCAAQPRAYARPLLRLVPPDGRARADRLLHEMDRSIGRWLLGRLIAMGLVGALVTAGLWLLHVPLALVLGVSAGLLTFVEYLGAIASAVAPLLVALTQGPLVALWVLALFLGVHVVDGYVVSPTVTKRMTRMPPAFTLSAQVFLGTLFGAAGVALAVPVAIVVVVLVRATYVEGVLGDRTP